MTEGSSQRFERGTGRMRRLARVGSGRLRGVGVLVLAALAVGVLLALWLRPTVSPDQGRYVAVVFLVTLDAALGGLRAHLERTFSERFFVIAFSSNTLFAVGLVWIGDRIGVDLLIAVAVVLGLRIFRNLGSVQRTYARGRR